MRSESRVITYSCDKRGCPQIIKLEDNDIFSKTNWGRVTIALPQTTGVYYHYCPVHYLQFKYEYLRHNKRGSVDSK